MNFLILELPTLPFLSTLFSNTLSFHSSLNVRDHVLKPNNTTGSNIALYIFIFKILQEKSEVFGLNNKILDNAFEYILCAVININKSDSHEK